MLIIDSLRPRRSVLETQTSTTYESKKGSFTVKRRVDGDLFSGSACYKYNAIAKSTSECQCTKRGYILYKWCYSEMLRHERNYEDVQ